METVKQQTSDGQVFSLVTLLGLASAAQIPTSAVTPESAQYQLLTKQLNSLQDMVASLMSNPQRNNITRKNRTEQLAHSPSARIIRDGDFRILIDPEDHIVRIRDSKRDTITELGLFDKIPDSLSNKLTDASIDVITKAIVPF